MTTNKWLSLWAVLTITSGCHSVREDFNDCCADLHSRQQARWAWRAAGPLYCDLDNQSSFQQGFEAGYRDVAIGGDGTPPTLPPAKYRGWTYQNESGQLAARAWLDGFSHGAVNASQDNVAVWNQVVTSVPPRPQFGRTNSFPLPPSPGSVSPTSVLSVSPTSVPPETPPASAPANSPEYVPTIPPVDDPATKF